jgi:tetratricopeptide (TPR) repeat protein
MSRPVWRDLQLPAGVLRETTPDETRIVLWLPAGADGGNRQWERLGNAPGAEVRVEEGLCATAATAILARQKSRGLLGNLLGLFQKSREAQVWALPNGESAEQVGPRQTDLLLVWAEDNASPLTEERLRGRWPDATRFQKVADNLFLVRGVQALVNKVAPNPAPPQGNPGEQAQQLLAAARQAGDRRREVMALTDLAIAWKRIGHAHRAVELLEEAHRIVQQLGDRRAESDVQGALGLAVLDVGQTARALELLQGQLTYAREVGDRFEQKIALEHQGLVYATLRDHPRAEASYQQALALAREVNDRQHEADLLWLLAIQAAEQEQRDQAIASAEAAIALFEKQGTPHIDMLREHLRRYRLGDVAGIPATGGLGSISLQGETPGVWVQQGGGTGAPPSGPGWLQMAFSALKSMAKALGSGMATVPEATQRKRLETCSNCEHHTGVRCRLCGCFTAIKTWLPHEDCPIGKWPPGSGK